MGNQSTKIKSGVFGYGAFGSKLFGEGYVPLSDTETDTVIISETPTASILLVVVGNDTVPITETASTDLLLLVVGDDTIQVTDTYSAFVFTAITASDTFNFTESSSVLIAPTYTESINILETYLSIVPHQYLCLKLNCTLDIPKINYIDTTLNKTQTIFTKLGRC